MNVVKMMKFITLFASKDSPINASQIVYTPSPPPPHPRTVEFVKDYRAYISC